MTPQHSTPILEKFSDEVLDMICQTVCDAGVLEAESKRFQRTANELQNSLKPLSLTSKHLRALCIPYLFDKFNLIFHESDPWIKAMEKLRGWNPEFARHVRNIHISLLLSYNADPEPFVAELPQELAKVLGSLAIPESKLSSITMQIDKTRATLFAEAFTVQMPQPVFPTITHVNVFPHNDFIIASCPNTKNLSGHEFSKSRGTRTSINEHSYSLLLKATKLEQLTSLMLDDSVTSELMEALHGAVPNISNISLSSYRLGMKFEELIDHIVKFQSLQFLSFPRMACLHVGYNPPRCGNAYMGPGGAELSRKLAKQRKEIEDRLARMILGEIGGRCKRVREVGFGSSRCRIKVNEEGKKELDWWTE